MRSCTQCSSRFAPLVIALTCAASATSLAAAAERVPFVRLREEAGHLAFQSCLPAGRVNFDADDPAGLQLHGFVFLTGDGEEKRTRMFRLEGKAPVATPESDEATQEQPSAPEFFINLQATPNPDHYALHVKVTLHEDGRAIQEEARLVRNCCGYYVSATRDGKLLPVGRGPLLADIMVRSAETYRQFERFAQLCCRPGFEFVPASQFSPSVIQEVVAGDKARPDAVVMQQFQELLSQLNSERFADREAAADALVRGGRATLWSLDRVEDQRLSAEQRHRLRMIRSKLAQFSMPTLPFQFPPERIRELTESPPNDWLIQLKASSESEVRAWSSSKLVSSTPATVAQPPVFTELMP